MTHIIAPIAEARMSDIPRTASRAFDGGATLVEVRIDALCPLQPHDLRALGALPSGKWVATLRSQGEGGGWQVDRNVWTAAMEAAVRAGAGWVDVEWSLVESEVLARETIQTVSAQSSGTCDILLSHHHLHGPPTDTEAVLAAMESAFPQAIAKVAWNSDRVEDSIIALELLRGRQGKRIVIPMGEKGVVARLLAPKCGAFGTFCAADEGEATAPGQPTLMEAIGRYRIQAQTPSTQVLGVIGSPVAHSRSPQLFNTQFAATGRDAIYLPVRIDSEEELTGFLDRCRNAAWLNVRGFSVTVPHKEAALSWVGANADPSAQRLGAVNTLVFEDGKVRGFNTDYVGAAKALEAGIAGGLPALANKDAAVLGSGGVARSVVAALHQAGARTTIFNRNLERGQRLASSFGCSAAPWDDRTGFNGEVVVNCTSVGMVPDVEATPMPASSLRAGMLVFDTVYTPRETRLLREARAAGCRCISGIAMFIEQAKEQNRLWFGEELTAQAVAAITSTA